MKAEKKNKNSSPQSTAVRGDWVQVHRTLLPPTERSDRVPEDTAQVPFEMWVNGFLDQEEASLGDEVEITTAIDRREHGILVRIEPGYGHSFGRIVPELLQIGRQLRSLLREAD